MTRWRRRWKKGATSSTSTRATSSQNTGRRILSGPQTAPTADCVVQTKYAKAIAQIRHPSHQDTNSTTSKPMCARIFLPLKRQLLHRVFHRSGALLRAIPENTSLLYPRVSGFSFRAKLTLRSVSNLTTLDCIRFDLILVLRAETSTLFDRLQARYVRCLTGYSTCSDK